MENVHVKEVELKDKVAEAFKTSTGEDTSATSAQPVYSILARELASVNPDSVSKVVDKNGEPLVVYHGTKDIFTTFSIRKTVTPQFWFTDSKTAIEKGEVGAAGKDIIL